MVGYGNLKNQDLLLIRNMLNECFTQGDVHFTYGIHNYVSSLRFAYPRASRVVYLYQVPDTYFYTLSLASELFHDHGFRFLWVTNIICALRAVVLSVESASMCNSFKSWFCR